MMTVNDEHDILDMPVEQLIWGIVRLPVRHYRVPLLAVRVIYTLGKSC